MLLEEQIKENRYKETLLQSQLEIQEQTLKNISQEIHDNIGQALTLAKLNLNTMPVSGDQQDRINTTKDIISKAISDLRDLGRSLNTDYIVEMGLQKALEYELGLIQKSTPIQTSLKTEGQEINIDRQKQLILFRIVQEVLNNSLKHASATQINILLQYEPEALRLSVEDNGAGFEIKPATADGTTGLGLRNMDNRARLIGASLTITSKPGQGTNILILLPLTKDEKLSG